MFFSRERKNREKKLEKSDTNKKAAFEENYSADSLREWGSYLTCKKSDILKCLIRKKLVGCEDRSQKLTL